MRALLMMTLNRQEMQQMIILYLGGNYDFSEGLSPDFMTLYSINLFYFSKIDAFPPLLFERLYKKGKKDGVDYFKEFLDVEVREVISNRARIYPEPNSPERIYSLEEKDLIQTLEYLDEWVKIKYVTDKGRTIIGWLKEEDLDVKKT